MFLILKGRRYILLSHIAFYLLSSRLLVDYYLVLSRKIHFNMSDFFFNKATMKLIFFESNWLITNVLIYDQQFAQLIMFLLIICMLAFSTTVLKLGFNFWLLLKIHNNTACSSPIRERNISSTREHSMRTRRVDYLKRPRSSEVLAFFSEKICFRIVTKVSSFKLFFFYQIMG